MSTERSWMPWVIGAVVVAAGAAIALRPDPGVVEKYEDEVEVAQAESADGLAEQQALDAVMLASILAEVDAIEAEMRRMNEEYLVSENANTGLYTVQQEQDIAAAYSRYLSLRKGLFHIAFRNKDYADIADQADQDGAFLLAYASGLSLYRNAVLFVVFFENQPNARRKLNEADPVLGIPAGTFEEMFANITSPDNVNLVLDGIDEYKARRARLEGSALVSTPGLEGLLARLDGNEQELAAAYERLGEGKRDVVWSRVKRNVADPAYEAQTFVSQMIGHIRTPLHAEGLTPQSIQQDIAPLLQPGDILLTRRDGYLSNAFLPGNWGHAAMYLGSADELRALGESAELEAALAESGFEGSDKDGFPFAAIEAIGEGVRLSSLEFALHANMLAVLRPVVPDEARQTAAVRAIKLQGTPYDFAFDLSSQDKIICTELVYRAYAPHLEVVMEDVMGRKTIKPDGMLQALSPAAEAPRTEFVLFGRAEDGVFVGESLDALMQTVAEAE